MSYMTEKLTLKARVRYLHHVLPPKFQNETIFDQATERIQEERPHCLTPAMPIWSPGGRRGLSIIRLKMVVIAFSGRKKMCCVECLSCRYQSLKKEFVFLVLIDSSIYLSHLYFLQDSLREGLTYSELKILALLLICSSKNKQARKAGRYDRAG